MIRATPETLHSLPMPYVNHHSKKKLDLSFLTIHLNSSCSCGLSVGLQIFLFLHSGLSASQDRSIYPAVWGKHTHLRSKPVHPVCLLQRSGAAVWEQQPCLEHLEGHNIMQWVLCVDAPHNGSFHNSRLLLWVIFQRSQPVLETLFMRSRGQPFPPAAPTPALHRPTGISSAPVSARQVRIACFDLSQRISEPEHILNNCWFIVVEDMVLNDYEGGFGCMSSPSCPCVFAGKSYSTGDTRMTKCQTW